MLMQARLAAAERVRREHEFEKQALRRKIETDALKIEALADMRHAMYVAFLPVSTSVTISERLQYNLRLLSRWCLRFLAGRYNARMAKMRTERIEMDRWRGSTLLERAVTPVCDLSLPPV
jgi:hypothetical protein